MGIRAFLSKPMARWVVKEQQSWTQNAIENQEKLLVDLVTQAQRTNFGEQHDFKDISNYDDFKTRVPIRDYEDLKPYFEEIRKGNADVTWPGRPLYLSKTSGTTSGTKYIPITRQSLPNHIISARNALLNYVFETGRSDFLDGNLIFLSGSPQLDHTGPIPTGRLSGIVNHHVPSYLRTNQKPSFETNCIEDWETKLESIIDETLGSRMSLISGIPPWVQMYFDRIIERTGKLIKDVFPSFSLLVYGGVNFSPYRKQLFDSIGKQIDSIETYPASEGFIAFQDKQEAEGLLLLTSSGIFYEFVPTDEFYDREPQRLSLKEVKKGVNYAVVLSSNAGLWSYSLGDTIKFISTDPHRIIVTGRIKHFISAFGEHVIGEEVENAIIEVEREFPEIELVEFTVAPLVTPDEGLPHHQWFIEFRRGPVNMVEFEKALDLRLQEQNSYYFDLISGNILQTLEVVCLKENAFRSFMKSKGKLGGQNKVPRLSNDRAIADELMKYRL